MRDELLHLSLSIFFPFKQLTPAAPSSVACDSNCHLWRIQRVVPSAATSHRVNVIYTLMSEQKAGRKKSQAHESAGSRAEFLVVSGELLQTLHH